MTGPFVCRACGARSNEALILPCPEAAAAVAGAGSRPTREARMDAAILEVVRWHEDIAAMMEAGGEGATAEGHRSIARRLVAAQVGP